MAGRSTDDPRAIYREAVRAVKTADRLAHESWDPRNPKPLARWERLLIVACALFAVFGGWVLLIVMFAFGGGSGDSPH
jgi:hypothetical protein